MKEKEPDEEGRLEHHIYDSAVIRDILSDSRAKKLGEYSIIYISSIETTVENLTDWYFHYVKVNPYNWCMILYTDSGENKGVYSIRGIVVKDVIFEQDEYGDYTLLEPSTETLYLPENDTLMEYID
ncbi:MAG: hypothetical protein LUC35_08640 [Clostridiales bacterium]|nr:hypothetical protein [Clostridiales bacterium]